jgi:hypothetical protein
VALPFVVSDATVLAVQAAIVAAPRPDPPGLSRLRRLGGRWWSLVPLGSIVVVIFAIRGVSETATGLTYLALVAVPILAALALGWGLRGAQPLAALAVPALFAVAWIWRTSLTGEGAALILSALSCITLGLLLSALTPPGWLKVGIVLMAVGDAYLVVTDLLQAPNNTLTAAHPAAGLPQLQAELFGSIQLGYGDLFIAAVLGAVLAREVHRQRQAALLTLLFAAAFDLLFFAVSELPATVPVALALIAGELWRRRRGAERRPRRRHRPAGDPRRAPAASASADPHPSTPAAATPRPTT